MNLRSLSYATAVVAFYQHACADTLQIRYDGTLLPAQASPAWTEYSSGNGKLSITPDGLRVTHKPSNWGETTQATYLIDAKRISKVTVDLTVRTTKADRPGAATFGIADGEREEFITFFPDRLYLHRAKVSVPFNFSDAFRRVEVERSGSRFQVSVDGRQLYLGTDAIAGEQAEYGRSPQILFGCLSAGATSDSVWRQINVIIREVESAKDESISSPQGAEPFTLFREPGVFPQFPVMRKGDNDTLYVRFGLKTSDSHMDIRGENITLRSHDGGHAWEPVSNAEWPLPVHWKGEHGKLVSVAANGWKQASDPDLLKSLKEEGVEVREAPDNSHYMYARGYHLQISHDSGKTWEVKQFALPGVAILMNHHLECTLVRLDARRLLRAVYSRPKPNKGYYESYILLTEDNGGSWEPIKIYEDPAGKLGFGETAITRAANGDIIAMLRQEPASNLTHLWVARSSNGGRTWSKPEQTPLVGHPPHLLTLADGKILCTYGYRQMPMGFHAAISRDNGVTWKQEDIRALRSDGYGKGADNGYPITEQLSDGSLVTIGYLTDRSNVTTVAGVRWRWQDAQTLTQSNK